ncbi:MAG: DUF4231 domain-containing protein [Deltaproteobacteria bacterium]|nr:DUF4231 domain-containing protein [Deltaproteobacteria bacterium]
MDEKKYLQERLDDQINWYNKKSQWHQKWYKGLKIIEIIAATSIPFFVGFMSDAKPFFGVITGLLGVIVAVISGIITLYKFQEIWTEYRTTCETLTHEKFLFQTKCEPYDIDNPFPLLVKRVEAIISSEHSNWGQYIKNEGTKEGKQK